MSPAAASIHRLEYHYLKPDAIQPSIRDCAAILMDNATGAIGKRKGLCRIKIVSSFLCSLFFHGADRFPLKVPFCV
jgi:hypothetical protein